MTTTTDTYKTQVIALIEKHGSPSAVPQEEMWHLMEVERAKAVLQAEPTEDRAAVMRKYAIMAKAAAEVLGTEPEEFVPVRKSKRADKYAAILTWCKENAGAETTVYDIAEIGNVSYSTANNFVKDRVDLFHKVKKGQYVVRDPEADRAADK